MNVHISSFIELIILILVLIFWYSILGGVASAYAIQVAEMFGSGIVTNSKSDSMSDSICQILILILSLIQVQILILIKFQAVSQSEWTYLSALIGVF